MKSSKYRFLIEGEFKIPYGTDGRPKDWHNIADFSVSLGRRMQQLLTAELVEYTKCTRIDVQKMGEGE